MLLHLSTWSSLSRVLDEVGVPGCARQMPIIDDEIEHQQIVGQGRR